MELQSPDRFIIGGTISLFAILYHGIGVYFDDDIDEVLRFWGLQ